MQSQGMGTKPVHGRNVMDAKLPGSMPVSPRGRRLGLGLTAMMATSSRHHYWV